MSKENVVVVFQNDVPHQSDGSAERPLEVPIETSEDFRTILNREFTRRIRVNPRYSLRAFAKSLGIYHATLSALLTGTRPFTPKSIRMLATGLGATPRQIDHYIEVFLKARGTSRAKSDFSASENYLNLATDAFALLSEWQHDAVLEALQLPDLRGDVKSIAAALTLSEAEVYSSLQTLLRAGLVAFGSNGEFQPTNRNTTQILTPLQTSAARREYQKALLRKSAEAIDTISLEQRDHTSMTLTVHPDDMPALRTMIKKFRRELTAFAQRKAVVPQSVYQLQISFFPLSQPAQVDGSPVQSNDANSNTATN